MTSTTLRHLRQTQSTLPMSLRWHVRCSSGGRTCPFIHTIPCAAWRSCSVAHPGPPGVDGAQRFAGVCGRSARAEPGRLEARGESRRGVRSGRRGGSRCCRASRSTDSTPGNQYSSEIDLGSLGVPTGRSSCFQGPVERNRNGGPCRWWTWPTSSGLERQGRRPKQPRAAGGDAPEVEAQSRQSYYQLVRERGLVAASTRRSRCRARLAPGRGHYRPALEPFWRRPGARAEVGSACSRWRPRSCRLPWRPARCFPARSVDPTFRARSELDFDPRPEPPQSDFEKRHSDVSRCSSRRADDARSRAARACAAAHGWHHRCRVFRRDRFPTPLASSGRDWSYQAGITLRWSLDLTTFANIRRQDADLDAERARELRTG